MKKDSYIFFDIDGTIYAPKLGVPDSTREAFKLLRKNGHHPVLCTGRSRCLIFPEIESLDYDGIIAGVGAYAQWGEDVLFNEVIQEDEIRKLMDDFIRFGFAPWAEGPQFLYYSPLVPRDPEEDLRHYFSIQNMKILKSITEDTPKASKVSALFCEGCDPEGFQKTIEGKYHGVNHYGILFETFSVQTNKGIGIKKLLKSLNAEDADTYAYGDSFNDLHMLETVKYGVAMGNSDPKFLERFPLHAGHIAEDGLYHSLKDFDLI